MSVSFAHHITGDGHLGLACTGDVDVVTAAELRRQLQAVAAKATTSVTLDLSLVEVFDAAGVAAVAATATVLRRRGLSFRLIAPDDDDARRILDYSGLMPLLAA